MVSVDGALGALLADGIIDDLWVDGQPRLSAEPEVLGAAQAGALGAAACSVAMMIDEAVAALAARPDLLRELGMDESLIAIAALDAPRWLALARADVFLVEGDDAAQVCELNCDTPTGLAECVALGQLAARAHPHLADPSAQLRERWLAMMRGCAADPAVRPVVGILDPTEMTEDLCHLRLITRWLEADGFTVVRGSPFNLHAMPGRRVGLFGAACDVLLRHYKTDWWARRASPWLDEAPPAHATPLGRELGLIADAQAAGTLVVVNPWGSAIAQNKRVLALPWERPELFAPTTLSAVRRHLPETRFLASVPREQLLAERERWVLKSDYGCEGDEVLLGSRTESTAWAEALRLADPGRWIVQRAFTPRRDAAGTHANHGVFLIGGLPSGIYTRRSIGATDGAARSLPTLVRR